MDSSPPQDETLKSRALSGTAWTTAHLAGTQLIRLAGNLVLTKLLFPEVFGIMSVVALLLTALDLFSDIGLHECVIVSRREDPAFLGTAMSMQAMRGLAIGALAWALATPIALFYETPEVQAIGPLFALSAVVRGLESPNIHVAGRHMQLKPLMIMQLSVQLVSVLIMIGLATVYRSVWALAIGGAVDAALMTAASHLFLPWQRVRFRWEAAARSEFFGYGRFLVVSSALTFVADSTGRLVFGKMLGMAVLGVYGIAHGLAIAPTMALSAISDRIIFPVYCRILERGDRLFDVFDKTRMPLLVAAGWMLTMVIGGGHAAVDLLYDPRYGEAGWMLQCLGVGAWFNVLSGTYSSALKASGNVKWHAAGTAVQTSLLVVLLPVGLQLWGIGGGIGALLAADFGRYLLGMFAAWRSKLGKVRSDLWLGGLLAISGSGSAWSADQLDTAPIWKLVAVFLIGTAVWSPLLLRMIRLGRTPSIT